MEDKDKSKEQLISELNELRKKLSEKDRILPDSAFTNTTQQNQTFENLRRTQEYLDSVLLNLPAGVAIFEGTDFRYFRINKTLAEFNGLSVEAHLGRPLEEVLPDAAQHILPRLKEVVKTGNPLKSREFSTRLPKDPDAIRWFMDFFFPIVGPEKMVIAVGVVVLDITRRKKMEEALSKSHDELQWRVEKQTQKLQIANAALTESESKYQGLYDSAPDMFASVDPNTAIVLRCNQTLATNLGYTKQEIIGRPLFELYHPDCLEQVRTAFKTFSNTGVVRNAKLHLKRKDGSSIDVMLNVSSIRDAQGTIMYSSSIWRDITDRNRIEQEQIRTQRLRAVGELSAGISHNLNNLLFGVLFPAEVLERETEDPEVLAHVKTIIIAGKRAQDLVRRLHQSVLVEEKNTIEPVSLPKVIQEAVRTARPRWKDEPESRNVTIEVVVELPEVPLVKGTASEMHDILTNLLFNAVDAMPEGGVIRIETQLSDGHVRLTMEDTGIGMEEKTSRRIFEPFFTTKPDVGTGLGLSSIYGTLTKWSGEIDVESTLGKGTTFILKIPLWKGEEADETEPEEVPPVRRASLLIVEDEQVVRNALTKYLSKTHKVRAFSNGEEALEEFAPKQYDVAFIDLGIPGVSGTHLSEEVKRIDPSIVTVLITGWSLEEGDERLLPFDFYLKKPFASLKKLNDLVAQATNLHDTRS